MDQRLSPLGTTLDGHVLETLEDWCRIVGVRGAKLALRAPSDACTCDSKGQPSNSSYTACAVGGPCPLLSTHDARILAQAGHPSDEVSLCLTCPLSSGDVLALQIDCPESSPAIVVSPIKQPGLAAPLLMFVMEALDRQSVEAHLEEMRERFSTELHAGIKAQEDEREWLALEVHDRIAQTLAAVFQQLQTVESLARFSPEVRSVAVRASVLCREVIRETRNIMNDLRPPVLDELGLVPLMEEELRHLEMEAGTHVQGKLTYRARPPRDIEVVLYRIFHEALINIRRHANATRLSVSLDGDDDAVRLEVEDNGVGFHVAESLAQKRVGGLMSMQRRAELSGGLCSVESKPGVGTKVTVQIPIAGRQT